MGRNRTPTAILDAKGAFIANPQRRRTREPKTGTTKGLGSAPRWLDDEHKKVWKEIAARLLPGVALASDRDAFEAIVRLTVRSRKGELQHAADYQLLTSLWSKFAMTPADRSKVDAEPAKETKLDQFLATKNKSSSPK